MDKTVGLARDGLASAPDRPPEQPERDRLSLPDVSAILAPQYPILSAILPEIITMVIPAPGIEVRAANGATGTEWPFLPTPTLPKS
jgi:hypothetical protein